MYLDPDRDLIGRKEIAKMTRRSWKTIRKWIENDGFPAKKLDGVWESNARPHHGMANQTTDVGEIGRQRYLCKSCQWSKMSMLWSWPVMAWAVKFDELTKEQKKRAGDRCEKKIFSVTMSKVGFSE